MKIPNRGILWASCYQNQTCSDLLKRRRTAVNQAMIITVEAGSTAIKVLSWSSELINTWYSALVITTMKEILMKAFEDIKLVIDFAKAIFCSCMWVKLIELLDNGKILASTGVKYPWRHNKMMASCILFWSVFCDNLILESSLISFFY